MNIYKRFSQNLQLVYDISAPSYKVSIFDEFYRHTFTFLQHSVTPASPAFFHPTVYWNGADTGSLATDRKDQRRRKIPDLLTFDHAY